MTEMGEEFLDDEDDVVDLIFFFTAQFFPFFIL
jgi:hypothetical protein